MASSKSKRLEVQRIQTGVRMERRVVKVLKALAEYKNMTLGDLLEGIVLHAFDGKAPFSAKTIASKVVIDVLPSEGLALLIRITCGGVPARERRIVVRNDR